MTPTKLVREYPLPAAAQTHEIVEIPGANMLVISQQTNSKLVKVSLDPATGAPVRAAAHLIGNPGDGLHGLFASREHPGMVWATLQFTSQIVLIDPVAKNVDSAPVVKKTYTLPVAAHGPHGVIEDGSTLWFSVKDGCQVVRIDTAAAQPFAVYPALRRPIFTAVHKSGGLIFATEDSSSNIMWINPTKGETGQIAIPANMGSTPVGMVAGPDGNVWFVLIGGASGTGTFGRIRVDKTGTPTIDWYHLAASAWKNAGLLHLAWECGEPEQTPSLLLLASSIVSPSTIDAVIRVTFDPSFSAVNTEASAALPTVACKSHRVLPAKHGWYVTELSTCQLAHISRDWVGSGLQRVDEAGDYYSDFGMGVRANAVDY